MTKLRIYITTTEEPLYINPFLISVMKKLRTEIIGVGIVKGSALKTRNQSLLSYLTTLAIISNPFALVKNAAILGYYKFCKALRFDNINCRSVEYNAKKNNISVKKVEKIDAEFLTFLKKQKPDIIINQSQVILSQEFLEIPKIGSLNRHCALLPKYRGRLAPFWSYVNGEQHTGISIHLIEKELDSGPIVVQKKIPITRFSTLESLLKRLFKLAPIAMVEAVNKIREKGYEKHLIKNDKSKATYFSSPKIKDAWKYRQVMLKRIFNGK